MRVPRVRKDYTFSGCTNGINGTGGNCYALVPADFQTIYNLNPLYQQGINGTGQTITVVEDSNTYGTDVATYRSTFLSKWSGTVTTVQPAGSAACTDPGTNAADGEADLDAEVASAIAPNAAIVVATCADTTTFGGLLAIENLVTSATPPGDHQHELWRVRSVQRCDIQCGLQLGISDWSDGGHLHLRLFR
jgi:subtilase family serine protease